MCAYILVNVLSILLFLSLPLSPLPPPSLTHSLSLASPSSLYPLSPLFLTLSPLSLSLARSLSLSLSLAYTYRHTPSTTTDMSAAGRTQVCLMEDVFYAVRVCVMSLNYYVCRDKTTSLYPCRCTDVPQLTTTINLASLVYVPRR